MLFLSFISLSCSSTDDCSSRPIERLARDICRLEQACYPETSPSGETFEECIEAELVSQQARCEALTRPDCGGTLHKQSLKSCRRALRERTTDCSSQGTTSQYCTYVEFDFDTGVDRSSPIYVGTNGTCSW